MRKFGEILKEGRKSKRISIKKASLQLLIKEEHLEALEKGDWSILPEPVFVKGYIVSYAKYLNLDWQHLLAVYRREFDEKKYPKTDYGARGHNKLFITPARIVNLTFVLAIFIFVVYIAIQYSSILSAPRLEILEPSDDLTVSVSVIQIEGKTESETIISIDGEFVKVGEDGRFSYQYTLLEGKNVVKIIASKRLSPKTKLTRTIRFSP